jgi:hypothetical protein
MPRAASVLSQSTKSAISGKDMINLQRTLGRSFSILGVSAALMLAQPAGAAEPTVSAQALGQAEALLSYCSDIDPAAATKYRERVKLLLQGASEETLAKMRKSDEYQQSHDAMGDLFGKFDPESGRRACAQYLAVDKK